MDDLDELFEFFDDILGKRRKTNDKTGQISYDCPVCSHEIKGLDYGDGKGNLELNVVKNAFQCWACSTTHDTHGTLLSLVKKFGNKKQLKYFTTYYEKSEMVETTKATIKLPDEYKLIHTLPNFYKLLPQAKSLFKYLEKRKISIDMCKKHNIGVAFDGYYKNRIIIPNYTNYKLDYFITRSFYDDVKPKYLNPVVEKTEIVWGQDRIDWSKPVELTEGVIDHLFVDNSIPLLGKVMYEKLFNLLYDKANEVVVTLDPDAQDNLEAIYHELNVGKLYGKVFVRRMFGDKDIAELCGINGLEKIKLD